MARVNNLTNFLNDVASAIKTKKGYQSTQKIQAADFDTEILSISTINNQQKTVNPTTTQQVITPDANYTGLEQVTIGAVTSAIDSDIQASNIKSGITILGVEGTLQEGIDTSDADAIASELYTGKTAYVDGSKITGTNSWTDTLAGGTLSELETLADNILGTSPTPPTPEIVPFATATDAQISALLDAHYAGNIDLSEIWNVGDTRVIHLDVMSAPVPGSNKAHVAQDMTFRIIGFNHDNLTTSIGSVTKAAVTIECKELLGNNGTGEYDYLSGNANGSTYENPEYFNNAYRRTWLNNNFINALPSTFKVLVKEVIKRNLQGHNDTTNYVETNDKAFLLSYPEVFSRTDSIYRNGAALGNYEGTQYAYYNQNNSNAGRKKYVNNNGSASSTAYYYWLRSPSSYDSSYWCRIGSDGYDSSGTYGSTFGLAPALAI